jgi:hypothetical protein
MSYGLPSEKYPTAFLQEKYPTAFLQKKYPTAFLQEKYPTAFLQEKYPTGSMLKVDHRNKSYSSEDGTYVHEVTKFYKNFQKSIL